jgi:exopolysaccharide production protein ExoY
MAGHLTDAISGPHHADTTTALHPLAPYIYDPRPVGGIEKRFFDIALASLTALLLLPLIVMICCLMRYSYGGRILYAHQRVGYGGRMFPCFKFRTMVEDSDAVLQRFLADNPAAALEWEATQKLRHDPRITPIGHFLRRSSLDELPQLINVVRGDMSCIGPRPIVPSELARYGSSKEDYLSTRPGLTGLWQVSGRTNLNYQRRVALDRYYVRNWSLLLDIGILARTIPAVTRSGETA